MLMGFSKAPNCGDIVGSSRQSRELKCSAVVCVRAGDHTRGLLVTYFDVHIGNWSSVGTDHHSGDTAGLHFVERSSARAERIGRKRVNLRETNAATKGNCEISCCYSAGHGPVPR